MAEIATDALSHNMASVPVQRYYTADSKQSIRSPNDRMQLDRKTYWRRQLRRTGLLLVVWAVVGFGFSILFVEQLNQIHLGEMPLGFWMAQQGSIYVFIALILLYAVLSGRADRQAGLEEERAGRLDRPVVPGDSEG